MEGQGQKDTPVNKTVIEHVRSQVVHPRFLRSDFTKLPELGLSLTMMDFGGVKVKEARHVIPHGRPADQQIRA